MKHFSQKIKSLLLITMLVLAACGGGGGSKFKSKSKSGSGGAGADADGEFTATPVLQLSTPEDDNQTINISNEAAYPVAASCVNDGGNVTISITSEGFSETVACNSGSVSTTLDLSALADGSYTITFTQENSSGATSTITRTIEKISDHCATPIGVFQSGDGLTSTTPFTICTVAQFNNLSTISNTGAYIKLMNNLDFAGAASTAGNLGSNIFDGNYLTIENINLTNTSMFGNQGAASSIVRNLDLKSITLNLTSEQWGVGILFGHVYGASIIENITGSNLTVSKSYAGSGNADGSGVLIGGAVGTTILKNIELSNVFIDLGANGGGTALYSKVGGVIGTFYSTSNLENISVTGTINGEGSVGGIVGEHNSASGGGINLSVAGNLSLSTSAIGGIIGVMGASSSGNFTNLSFEGTIEPLGILGTEVNIGGLIGHARGTGTLSDSYAIVNILNNPYSYIGGFFGQVLDMEISNSWTDITLDSVEGYVGGMAGNIQGTVSITNSYAIGTIDTGIASDDEVGGIYGEDNFDTATVTLTNVYWGGTINANGAGKPSQIGDIGPTCTNCFYNSTTNTYPVDGIAATGLTTAQMQNITNFPGIDNNANWKMDSSISLFPVLSWQD